MHQDIKRVVYYVMDWLATCPDPRIFLSIDLINYGSRNPRIVFNHVNPSFVQEKYTTVTKRGVNASQVNKRRLAGKAWRSDWLLDKFWKKINSPESNYYDFAEMQSFDQLLFQLAQHNLTFTNGTCAIEVWGISSDDYNRVESLRKKMEHIAAIPTMP